MINEHPPQVIIPIHEYKLSVKDKEDFKDLEKEFVPYEIALELKKLGFEDRCFGYYFKKSLIMSIMVSNNSFEGDNVIAAPIYSQTFRFLRNKYKIHSNIQELDINNYYFFIDDGINKDVEVLGFETYEQAEQMCLIELIKIIKKEL